MALGQAVQVPHSSGTKLIAYEIGVAEATVKAHVSALLRKLQVRTRSQAITLLAIQPALQGSERRCRHGLDMDEATMFGKPVMTSSNTRCWASVKDAARSGKASQELESATAAFRNALRWVSAHRWR